MRAAVSAPLLRPLAALAAGLLSACLADSSAPLARQANLHPPEAGVARRSAEAPVRRTESAPPEDGRSRAADSRHRPEPPFANPEAALGEGNRLFRAGDLSRALAIYAGAWGRSRRLDPLLAYNLGATAQHLGRLPEAILWYRRAELAQPDDGWLRENLALARDAVRSQGAVSEPVAPGLLAHRQAFLIGGTLLAWGCLPLLLVPPRQRGAALLAGALLAGSTFGLGVALGHYGPKAAVLLRSCAGKSGEELPAGSEVWVQAAPGGTWRVAGRGQLLCPASAVALVDSQHP